MCGAIAMVTAHSLQATGRIHREEKWLPTPDSWASDLEISGSCDQPIVHDMLRHAATCCDMLSAMKKPRDAMVIMFARRSKRWSTISLQVASHEFPGQFQNGILNDTLQEGLHVTFVDFPSISAPPA